MEKGWKSSVRMTSASSRAWTMTLTVSPSPPDFFAVFSATLMSSSIYRRFVLASCGRRSNAIGPAGKPSGGAQDCGRYSTGSASMITNAWAIGNSSVMVRWMTARWPRRQQLGQPRRGTAGELHGRLAAGQVHDAHVAPEDALGNAGAERLRAGLLGGEALGIGGGAAGPALGARPLDVGEDARQEPLAVARQRLLDAADVDRDRCRCRGSCRLG